LKIGIEVDGQSHNSAKAKERDSKKDRKLEELGWHILRFRNEEVLENLNDTLLTIKSFMEDATCNLENTKQIF